MSLSFTSSLTFRIAGTSFRGVQLPKGWGGGWQMSASKIPVMEIEMDYSHFQHLIQTSSDGFAPDVTPHPVTVTLTDAAGSPAVFPLSEVIDLSTSASEQCPAVSGEKTPGTYGEVPGFLLDITRVCPSGPCAKTSVYSHNHSGSAARVCLEKRFKTMSADASNHQDIRYWTPGKHISLIMTPYLNLYYVLGFFQSLSSLRRGSSNLKFSPGLTPTGQMLSRIPAHLSHLFSTQLLM